MNYIVGIERSQLQIECLDEFIEEDNEVRVIDKVIDSFDIDGIGFYLGDNDEVGRPKFDPRDILKLFIYGCFNGIRSSRKLAKQAIINKELIWLLKGVKPKYRVIADFRKDNKEALEKIFSCFVDFCIELGLYGKELIAVDGTKIEASASKRKHYSRNKLSLMKERIKTKINEYIDELAENDKLEDTVETLEKKENLTNAIKKLEEKNEYYDNINNLLDKNGVNEINLTDPDARTVKFGAHQGTDVGYNIQTAVDSKYNLIIDYDVINNSTDHGQLYNMGSKAIKKLKVDAIEVLADKGYYDLDDIEECEKNDISVYVSKPTYKSSIEDYNYFADKFKYNKEDDTYTCPKGQILNCITQKEDASSRAYQNFEACGKCEYKDKCTSSSKGRRITRKINEYFGEIANKRVKADISKYNRRMCIVEHPFGTLKRTMSFTYLLTRKFEKVRCEVSIAFFTYNLKRVINILGINKLIDEVSKKKIIQLA